MVDEDGVCVSSPEDRSRTWVVIVSGEDRGESLCRWNSTKGRDSPKVQ